MTKQQQEILLVFFHNQMENIINKKGNDYANGDRLSNFKLAGDIINISPEKQCLSLIATKVARLGNLLDSNLKVQNESIQDSILDLANYSFLLFCLTKE